MYCQYNYEITGTEWLILIRRRTVYIYEKASRKFLYFNGKSVFARIFNEFARILLFFRAGKMLLNFEVENEYSNSDAMAWL